MKKAKPFLIILALSALFAFFYVNLVIPKFKAFDLRITRRSTEGTIVRLPGQEDYMLKVWGPGIPRRVSFNSKPLLHVIFRDRETAKELYFKIPKDDVKPTGNTLEIFPVEDISFRIKNNLSYSDFGSIVFRTRARKAAWGTFLTALGLFAAGALGFWLAVSALLRRLFGLDLRWFLVKAVYSCVPCFMFFSLVYGLNRVLPMPIVFFPFSFVLLSLSLVLFSLTLFLLFFIFRVILLYVQRSAKNISPAQIDHLKDSAGAHLAHLTTSSLDRLSSLKDISLDYFYNSTGYKAVLWYLKRDFTEKCVLWFFFLQALACVFLLSGMIFFPDLAANASYFILVLGVARRIWSVS